MRGTNGEMVHTVGERVSEGGDFTMQHFKENIELGTCTVINKQVLISPELCVE